MHIRNENDGDGTYLQVGGRRFRRPPAQSQPKMERDRNTLDNSRYLQLANFNYNATCYLIYKCKQCASTQMSLIHKKFRLSGSIRANTKSFHSELLPAPQHIVHQENGVYMKIFSSDNTNTN